MKKFSAICLISYILNLISFPTNAQQSQWAWMKGDSTGSAIGIFGTMGIPNAANKPPALYEPCEWRDHDGNFWLLGGGYYYNTLWKFDAVTTEWTWMKGTGGPNGNGVYGTQGVSNPNNTPGVRVA